MAAVSSFRRWTIKSQEGIDKGLEYSTDTIPTTLGDEDVLVEIHAASLNYRDLVILKLSSPTLTAIPNVIPGSDGAGMILATGSSVSKFVKGDRVVTHLTPGLDEREWPTWDHIYAGLGQKANGTLTEYGAFHQSALVKMPANLSFEQAATLTCSALTAWNALFGLRGQEVKAGDWVLVQGTGGVSIAALQFALAAGATVIATTSNDAKAAQLKTLGAHHVLNYRSDPNWGATARSLTPNARGIDHVVDVGGDNTLSESMKAVRTGGIVSVVGLVAGPAGNERPALLDTLWQLCIVRGVLLGTREQFTEMNGFIEQRGIDIALDDEVFGIERAKDAYKKVEAQKHFSKVVIKMK